MKEFQLIFLWVASSLLYHPRNISCVVVSFRIKFYNSRALKCMLLFDVCLNYSTRWIIIWNRCACAVHKMLGISHKILVSLSRSGYVCCSCMLGFVFLQWNFEVKKVWCCIRVHTITPTHDHTITQRHTAWVGFGQSVLRYIFFSLRKLILDMYIWAIAYWRLHWLLKKELLCVCMREGCAVRINFANLTETIRRN